MFWFADIPNNKFHTNIHNFHSYAVQNINISVNPIPIEKLVVSQVVNSK